MHTCHVVRQSYALPRCRNGCFFSCREVTTTEAGLFHFKVYMIQCRYIQRKLFVHRRDIFLFFTSKGHLRDIFCTFEEHYLNKCQLGILIISSEGHYLYIRREFLYITEILFVHQRHFICTPETLYLYIRGILFVHHNHMDITFWNIVYPEKMTC